jgi:hypothetical protein
MDEQITCKIAIALMSGKSKESISSDMNIPKAELDNIIMQLFQNISKLDGIVQISNPIDDWKSYHEKVKNSVHCLSDFLAQVDKEIERRDDAFDIKLCYQCIQWILQSI